MPKRLNGAFAQICSGCELHRAGEHASTPPRAATTDCPQTAKRSLQETAHGFERAGLDVAAMRRACFLVVLLAGAANADDVNCSKMRVKELRVFLADRGLKCANWPFAARLSLHSIADSLLWNAQVRRVCREGRLRGHV